MGRNWDWAYQQGKEQRLEAELSATCNNATVCTPTLFSHDPTINSYFFKGWHSVTQCEINTHTSKTPPPPSMVERLSKLKELRQCHF